MTASRPNYRPAQRTSLSRLAEDVPDAAHGLDQRRLVAIDLAAQVADVRLEHARVAAEVVMPHMVEDLSAREDAAGVDQQIAEQAVLGRGQLDDVGAAADLVRLVIQLEVGQVELPALGAAASMPSQDDPNAGHQLLDAEGLGDIVVPAEGQAVDLVLGGGLRGP